MLVLILLTHNLDAQIWRQNAKVKDSIWVGGDWFGSAVSISGDIAIVGAPLEDEDAIGGNFMKNAGAAYVFELDTTGKWQLKQKLVASDRTPGACLGGDSGVR
ncbi:MAG: FG-GAP repeat protein [Bacteroidetes bacterium]|nr:FG-GAP repeat protein [Bacteroidota bacterium]